MLKIDSAYNLLHDGVLALSKVEQQGMRIDVEYIEHQNLKIDKKIKKLEAIIYDSQFYADWQKSNGGKPVNIYSGQQMAKYLYKIKGIKPKKETASGQGSTDIDTLTQLGIPELDTFLQIKKLQKIKTTYLDGFLREQIDGVIHPFFNLHLARTYRSSSDRPNFQNIPIRDKEAMDIIRGAIFPTKGNLILELDNSQLEVRIAACYHKDPKMMWEIQHGHDFHTDLATQIFCLNKFDPAIHKKVLRNAAKNGFVFPQFYGDYYKNCAANVAQEWCKLPTGKWKPGMGVTIGDAHISDILIDGGINQYGSITKDPVTHKVKTTGFIKHIQDIEYDFWNKRYPVYNKWKENWWKEYQKNGYFYSKTGFLYQGIMSRNDAVNYPVQGAAFHVLLWTLIKAVETFEKRGMKTRVMGQVHDSIVLDVYPPELDKVVTIMKQIMEVDVVKAWPWIIVPMKVEADICPIDGSWSQKKEFKI